MCEGVTRWLKGKVSFKCDRTLGKNDRNMHITKKQNTFYVLNINLLIFVKKYALNIWTWKTLKIEKNN